MARKPRQPQQPGALSPQLPAASELYRTGVYAELQKFGRSKEETTQLLLSEPPAELADIEILGLDLTVSEDKALSALQILLHRTDYQGNLAGEELYIPPYKTNLMLPKLQFTPSEYFDTYGLKKYGNRYQGAVVKEAMEALRSLAEKPRIIAYQRRAWQGSGKSRKLESKTIVYRGTMIQMLEAYDNLTAQELEHIVAGETVSKRATKIAVQFGPLIMDSIETFFLIKPASLHREIEDFLGAKNRSRSVSLFIQWLLTWNKATFQISKERLARKLRLDYMLDQRKPSLLRAQLQQCFETATALGFLLEYREDAFGVLTFRLNPERCKRLGQQEGPEEEEK